MKITNIVDHYHHRKITNIVTSAYVITMQSNGEIYVVCNDVSNLPVILLSNLSTMMLIMLVIFPLH